MLYSEFSAITDAARLSDVELTYKNLFTDFQFTIKSTHAINGDSWLWVILTDFDNTIKGILESFDIVYFNPEPGKFLFMY